VARDLLEYLRDNRINTVKEPECRVLIKYFDSREKDSLNFMDFLQILLPSDQPYLRTQAS
jgi:hypothetical protein